MSPDPNSDGRSARCYGLIALLSVTAAIVTASPTAAAAGAGTLAVGDAAVDLDGTAAVRVSLDEVPDGLSGFEVRLRLADGDVGRVTNASYPDRFQPTTEPEIGPDGRSVRVKAADLGDEVGPGAANVTLATVTVAGTAEGATAVTVESARIDADGGEALDPSVDGGTVVVGDGESTAADGPGSGGGAGSPDGSAGGAAGDGSGTADPLGVPTAVGVALAAVVAAALAAGLLAKRRA